MTGPATPDLVAHLWKSYLPGNYNDPHQYLWDRYGIRSRVLAADLVENGAPVPENTSWVRRREAGRAWRGGLAGRAWEKGTGELTWRRFLRRSVRSLGKPTRTLLHAHFGTTGALAMPIVEQTHAPLVVTFYGVDASAALASPRWRERYRRMFLSTDLCIVLCDAVRDRLVGAGCPDDKVVVWNLPAGIEDFPYRPPAGEHRVRFVIAARFVEKKGYPVLLEAFRRLVSEGRDVSLLAIGYGPGRYVIEDRVASLGLDAHVTILDTLLRPDFHRVFDDALRRSDIFVLPSVTAADGDDEGGPALTLVCAQAAGLPVICTPFPGAERSVVDGVTGVYCEPGSVDSLAQKMRRLMDSPEQWAPLGLRASEHVGRHFSLDGQMRELVALYEQVTQRRWAA